MPLILGANSVSGGYEIDNSLRFNAGSNDFLSRTTGTPTNNKILTFSTWIKRSTLSTYMDLFDQDGGSSYGQLQLTNGDAFVIYQRTSGSTDFHLQTTQLFRDVSAWYHLVVAYDTTQATSSNRIKLYVNGTQVTSFSIETYPSQNLAIRQNTSSLGITIANYSSGSNQYAGYLSEIFMIDGQQLTPSSFGETDEDTNIWKPIPYTGSFGTNGFYLEFQNSGALGTDSSGNGNNFTVNNLTSVDQSTDTPTNNFCTMNPLFRYSNNSTFSEGNLKLTQGGTATWNGANGTMSINKGKWYYEAKFSSGSNLGDTYIGFVSSDDYNGNPYQRGIQFYNADGGEIYAETSATTSNYGTFTSGDIIGLALDYDNSYFSVYKNGTALVTNYNFSSSSSSAKGGNFTTPVLAQYGVNVIEFNFGNPPFTIASGNADANGYGNFEYAVPSGYYSLCTKNLAEYA